MRAPLNSKIKNQNAKLENYIFWKFKLKLSSKIFIFYL